MKSHLLSFCIFGFVLCFPAALLAQDTASITGSVTDSSGAAIAGAQVTMSSQEHGVNRAGMSNASGDYLFAALPIGSYDLIVAAPGFKKFQAKGIILQVGQKARVDVAMQVGGTNTEVTVEGASVAQVETQASELAGVVTGKEISQLQLNGRNFTQLVTLVPGVSNQSGQDEGAVGVQGNVAYSINGGRTEYNNWELDGGDNLDNGSNTSMNVYPSLESIAEFKVLTSNYGAQYGRNGSGTVEVETKSGTNQFHGSAYEFLRNDFFNARNYFNPGPVPEYKKHDYGYTIGGPVYIPGVYNKGKEKTFFFWSQEWRKERVPAASSLTTVPTTAERSGNFNDVCPGVECPHLPGNPTQPFPGNLVPIDTAHGADALEALIPAPTQESNGTATWQAFPILPTTWREELVRVDHNFSPKVRGMFRYIHDSWSTVYPNPLWTAGASFPTLQTNFNGPSVGMVARLTTAFSPTLLNEFVASYTTDHINLTLIGPWQRPSTMSWGLFPNGGGGKVAGISLGGDAFNNISVDPGYIPNGPLNSNPTYSYRDNVTKIVGKHNLQFGGYFTAAQKNEIPQPGRSTNGFLTFDATNSTVSTGNSFADLLTGSIAKFEQQKASIKTYNRYKIFEPYFQDDWHATNRLTLNLGLRLSLFGTQHERYHNAWNWDPTHYVPGASNVDPTTGFLVTGATQFNGWVQCGVGGVPDGCAKNHLANFAPRIGFAFDPKGDGKWAVRGGYGIFYEHMNSNEAGTGALEPQNPLTLTSSVVNVLGYGNIAPQSGGTLTPLSVISVTNKINWPYMQQWHFDVQHEVVRNTVATLSYVGSKGTHLSREFDLNQVHSTPLSQNPYKPGEPIGSNDCSTMTTPSGVPVTGQAAVNLSIACGADANPFRPFVGVAGIQRKEQTAGSVYHGMQLGVRHTLGGLVLNLAYTYSHSIDDASSGLDQYIPDTYNLNAYRASSNFDQRHLFSLSYVYDLPFLKGTTLTDKLLGGWQWSGITIVQTGSPFSAINGVFGDNAGVANTVTLSGSFADLAGNPNAGLAQVPPNTFGPPLFNPGAFVAPRGLTFGDTPRNFLNNPRRTNFDMALFKHFMIKERIGFEFRAEAFNIFNHTQFAWLGGGQGSAASNSTFSNPTNSATCYGGANNSAGDPSCVLPSGSNSGFLRANSAHNPRILQLGLKFMF
jgi:hypothetical protein